MNINMNWHQWSTYFLIRRLEIFIHKLNKIWGNQVSEFYNGSVKLWMKAVALKFIQHKFYQNPLLLRHQDFEDQNLQAYDYSIRVCIY